MTKTSTTWLNTVTQRILEVSTNRWLRRLMVKDSKLVTLLRLSLYKPCLRTAVVNTHKLRSLVTKSLWMTPPKMLPSRKSQARTRQNSLLRSYICSWASVLTLKTSFGPWHKRLKCPPQSKACGSRPNLALTQRTVVWLRCLDWLIAKIRLNLLSWV